jgi:hypothetical protein
VQKEHKVFDKLNIVQPVREYVPYAKTVTVQEHRAPTDDSIRIYKEMEEKANKNILCSIEIRDNILNINAVVIAPPEALAAWKCLYHFTLNGRDIQGEIKLKYHELMAIDKNEILRTIVDQAARHIAVEMLQHLPELPR